MSSEIEICNRALTHTGTDQTIASLTEQSKEARLCRQWYEASRDRLLRTFAWNFAQRRAVLADMGSPPSGWDFRYRYPVDCLKLGMVYPAGSIEFGRRFNMPGHSQYVFEVASSGDGGRVVLTDCEDAEAVYTVRVDDTNLFPPDFAGTLELALAANIAMPLTSDPRITQFIQAQAQAAINDAMATNLNEAHEPEPPEAEWIRAHVGIYNEDTWHNG